MANELKYRGYIGSIEVSQEDNLLFGQVRYIRALVNYEGQTVPELVSAFQEAVDDYLETCEGLGVEPEKPCKGTFNVRVGHDLHLAAVQAAEREHISLNELVCGALNSYLEHR